jgi:hypothetical protein
MCYSLHSKGVARHLAFSNGKARALHRSESLSAARQRQSELRQSRDRHSIGMARNVFATQRHGSAEKGWEWRSVGEARLRARGSAKADLGRAHRSIAKQWQGESSNRVAKASVCIPLKCGAGQRQSGTMQGVAKAKRDYATQRQIITVRRGTMQRPQQSTAPPRQRRSRAKSRIVWRSQGEACQCPSERGSAKALLSIE